MDAVGNNQPDARELPSNLAQWVDTLSHAYAELQSSQQRIQELEQEIAELQQENAKLKQQPHPSGTPAKIAEPFSLRAEEKRQEARGQKKKPKQSKKGRRGRLANEDKIRRAERTEDVFPEGVAHDRCRLSHVR